MSEAKTDSTGAPRYNRRTISHVNLHYRKREDGPLAALLMERLGLVKSQEIDLPDGSSFYRFTVNSHDINRGDGIIYLSQLPAPLAGVVDAIQAALGVDGAEPHPCVEVARAAQEADPELNFHVGFLLESLDELEAIMLDLQTLERTDPRFAGRMRFVVNRAPPGNPQVDARLDASPIYNGVTRYTYGHNGVQAFVVTDLVVTGPLAEALSFELDYVFPGYDRHILSVSEFTRE